MLSYERDILLGIQTVILECDKASRREDTQSTEGDTSDT